MKATEFYGPNRLRPAHTLEPAMNECHVTHNHRTAIIVYDQSNFDNPYPQKSRSYASHSNQWGWGRCYAGHCRLGSCLDGTDQGIRLDHYNWVVEGWYWEEESDNV